MSMQYPETPWTGPGPYPTTAPTPYPTTAPMPYPSAPPSRYPPVYMPPYGRVPTGTNVAPMVPGTEEGPPTRNIGYIQGFLRRNMGRFVRIEFLLGTSTFQDRTGTILEVGTDYVVLREPETDDELMCDLYSIKFVRVYL